MPVTTSTSGSWITEHCRSAHPTLDLATFRRSCLQAERARWWTPSRRRRHSLLIHAQGLARTHHRRMAMSHQLVPCQLPSVSCGALRWRHGYKCRLCRRSAENLSHFDRFACRSAISWSERVGYAKVLRRFERIRGLLLGGALRLPAWESRTSSLAQLSVAVEAVGDLGGIELPLVRLWPSRAR